MEAFPKLELSKVSFSQCVPPIFPFSKQIPSKELSRQLTAGDDAVETKQRDSASTKTCVTPWPWHPLPKVSTSPGAGGTDPSAGDTQSPNTLVACANDTLGWSNAALGSVGPESCRASCGRPDPAPGSVYYVALVCVLCRNHDCFSLVLAAISLSCLGRSAETLPSPSGFCGYFLLLC